MPQNNLFFKRISPENEGIVPHSTEATPAPPASPIIFGVNEFSSLQGAQLEVEDAILNETTMSAVNSQHTTTRSDRFIGAVANPDVRGDALFNQVLRLQRQIGNDESPSRNSQRQLLNQIITALMRMGGRRMRPQVQSLSNEDDYLSGAPLIDSSVSVNEPSWLRNHLFSPTPQISDYLGSGLRQQNDNRRFTQSERGMPRMHDKSVFLNQQPPIKISGIAVQRGEIKITFPDEIVDAHDRFLEFVISHIHGEEVLEHLTCPITLSVYREPVQASDGYVYEKVNILKYIQREEELSPDRALISPFRIKMTKSLVYREDISDEINRVIHAINDGQFSDLEQDFQQHCQIEDRQNYPY